MKKIIECRLMIIDNEGKTTAFPYTIGKQHQECLDEYANNKHYEYSNIEYIVDKDNAVFYNLNREMVVCYMPKKLTDEQLALLDILSLKMDDIKYMEVRKYLEQGYQDFTLEGNIGIQFSDEIIQSYFKKER